MKLHYAFLALLATVALAGCHKQDKPKDDENKGHGEQTETVTLTAPTLSADKTAVSLEEASAASAALKLDWTAASEEAAVTYKLYVNLGSRDLFTTPKEIDAATALSHTFTHGELNTILTDFGAEGQTEIQFGVYASAADAESVLSNVVKLSITPYAEKFQNPAAIYVIGTATPYAWDLSTALEIKPATEGVYSSTGLPLRVLPLANNQSIKFAFSRDGSDPRFAGQAPGAAFGDITVVETGQGYEFFPATAGYDNGVYDISVNFNTMKFSITRTGDLPEEALPDKLYMLGDCFEWTWNFTGTTLDKVSGKTYKAENVNMNFGDGNNGFKVFLGENKWSPYFAAANDATYGNVKIQKCEDTDVPQFKPGLLGYTSGSYDITMDFDTMVATFTRKGDIQASEPEVLWLVGSPFSPSWQFNESLCLTKTAPGTYTASDIAMDFGPGDYGFRIYVNKDDWNNCYTYKDGGYDATGIQLEFHDAGGDPPQIFPGQCGFSSGTYDLSFNTSSKWLSLTKK